jgi:hypothetical protein
MLRGLYSHVQHEDKITADQLKCASSVTFTLLQSEGFKQMLNLARAHNSTTVCPAQHVRFVWVLHGGVSSTCWGMVCFYAYAPRIVSV